jgi:hypothetical protein
LEEAIYSYNSCPLVILYLERSTPIENENRAQKMTLAITLSVSIVRSIACLMPSRSICSRCSTDIPTIQTGSGKCRYVDHVHSHQGMMSLIYRWGVFERFLLGLSSIQNKRQHREYHWRSLCRYRQGEHLWTTCPVSSYTTVVSFSLYRVVPAEECRVHSRAMLASGRCERNTGKLLSGDVDYVYTNLRNAGNLSILEASRSNKYFLQS